MQDPSGREVLDPDQCLFLLGHVSVGRVIFHRLALPGVELVHFTLHQGAVVFRAAEGSELAAAIRGAVVAFQADSVALDTGTGWSVTVIGRARLVRDDPDLADLSALELGSLTPAAREVFATIKPEIVSGRRFRGQDRAA